MAQIFTATVYQINENQPMAVPELQGFSPANVKFRPAAAGSVSYAGVPLYGIVEELPRGLRVNSTNFYVVETVAQLATNANK